MDIEVVSNRDEFAALHDEWNELLSRSASKHIFLTHEWQYTWWEHFGTNDKDLLILLARDGERLVGIAPLRRDVLRVRGVPVLRLISFLLGYEADYRDLILEEGREWDVLEALLAYLAAEVPGWQILSLAGVHGESRSNELLPVVSKRCGLHHHAELAATCPFIPLPGTAEIFLAEMSRSTRAKFQQKLRKWEREEGVARLEVHRGECVTKEDVSRFINLHAASWKERGGSRAVHSIRIARFHHDLVAAMQGTDWPLISLLTVAGEPRALIYGFLYDGVFYDYLPGHDPALAAYSPGAQAIMKTVEHGIAEGWREFDLLRGDEGYKFHFTRRVRHTLNHYVTASLGRLKLLKLLQAAAG